MYYLNVMDVSCKLLFIYYKKIYILEKYNKMCNFFKNIFNFFKIGNTEIICLICLEPCKLYKAYNLNCCKDIGYHKNCLAKTIIYNNKCPICRKIVYKSPSLKLES